MAYVICDLSDNLIYRKKQSSRENSGFLYSYARFDFYVDKS